ncbi:M48 family metallopeptidase [Alcaligenaceae bacterium]|nr:M48 family metallopeptidase [Alcaligenaceae bacterium]
MRRVEQLDLFGGASGTAKSPVAHTTPATPPIVKPLPPLVITPPPTLPKGTCWREVHTPQQAIGFVIIRSRRSSIGLVVNDDGLQIRAPSWVSLSQIDAAVIERANWILDKLKIRQQRQAQLATATTQWETGGIMPYMGVHIHLKLDANQQEHTFSGDVFNPAQGDTLALSLPSNASRERVRDSVHAWLQQQALLWFEQRLQYFLTKGQLTIQRWRLSSATTRWGSCSSNGNIMLNWRLIHFKHAVIDYVIAHEVAHLREMNHSKHFWREVEQLMPDFAAARNALRQHNPGSLPLL